MNNQPGKEIQYASITKAENLEAVWSNFDPTLVIDPDSDFYISRSDSDLRKLAFHLKNARRHTHAFLCGHRGSGKTTELARLCADKAINEKFIPIYLTARNFGSESIHLTHDAVMVEIGLKLAEEGKKYGMSPDFSNELENWGKKIVTTFLKDENMKAEVGAKAGSKWFAYFKAQLGTRREWKHEEKLFLEPKVQDLIDILNKMAQDLKNKTKKQLLVIVDDLEKGESDADKEMHKRLFQENYTSLVQPRFSIIYTLPIYFRALPGSRIPNDEMFAFSAARLYEQRHKQNDIPPLSKEEDGYKLMKQFVVQKLARPKEAISEDALDELLRIGGGLFRETARCIQDAAYLAILRGSGRIEREDADKVYDEVKKEYQPLIRGDALQILSDVLNSTQGWVSGVEPYLQSRAVVEYENGDIWIDLRHVLKPHIKNMLSKDG